MGVGRATLDLKLEPLFWNEFMKGARHPRGEHRGEPIRLYDYQKEMIHGFFSHQINNWEIGRQGTKTSTSGLILAFLSDEIDGDAVISSFREERATEIVGWVKEYCQAHKDPRYAANLINDATKSAIFGTGFRVIALPHGQSARGYTTRVVVTDESQLMDNEDLSALLPTGLTTRPKRIHMGTVWGTSGWFWRLCRNADTLGHHLTHITSEQALEPEGPIVKSELDRLKVELGELQFNQECLLIPIPDIDTFYGQALVDSCVNDYSRPDLNERNIEIVGGFDHAVSGGDESVAFIGVLYPNGKLVEYEVRRWLNTLIYSQVNELAQSYPTCRWCVDATAEGGKECLGYFQRAGLGVFPVDFGKSKPTLMITHKNRMQQGLFKFQDEKTRVQHVNYRFKESETVKGRYKYGERGTPDDRVDAAALADYRAFLITGYGGAEKAAEWIGEELRFDNVSPGL